MHLKCKARRKAQQLLLSKESFNQQVKMKENIDFTSDDPTDQDMTHFDESGSENKEERANGQNKRKHEDDNEYVAIASLCFRKMFF